MVGLEDPFRGLINLYFSFHNRAISTDTLKIVDSQLAFAARLISRADHPAFLLICTLLKIVTVLDQLLFAFYLEIVVLEGLLRCHPLLWSHLQ